MTEDSHKHEGNQNLKIAVVTVSTSRTRETDVSGDVLKDIIEKNGHSVADYGIVPDAEEEIAETVKAFITEGAEAVIVNGGTGISPSDVTIEAVAPLFDKELSAFGQLMAIVSYEEIKTKYINSRSTAGIVDGAAVYCIPGSPSACKTAAEKLIMPTVGHTVKHARED